MINYINWRELRDNFISAKPFNHVIIDNFFKPEIALELSKEFPDYNSDIWFEYGNNLENKKLHNLWNLFPKVMYNVFHELNGSVFIDNVKELTGIEKLYPDLGLHGGGCHLHARGGKLNVHKDYSIHPKLKLHRKLNIIIYLTPEWDLSWGGGLELWSSKEDGRPNKVEHYVDCIFNRAVIFDTTQNSWHGLPEPIECPENFYRKSLAIYYLTDPPAGVDDRERALFAPHKEQADNPEILELIKQRSDATLFENSYRKNV